ncbi:hypothetical protein PENSPDRAFT_180036 [Peniophora sp. CONT]|nr:hypothetical protein PENSPDRAFT_180036 [Peniophora sp. CONT]
MASTTSNLTGFASTPARDRRASFANALAALASMRSLRPVFTPRMRMRSASASVVPRSVMYAVPNAIADEDEDEDRLGFDVPPVQRVAFARGSDAMDITASPAFVPDHSGLVGGSGEPYLARGGDTVDMAEVEDLVSSHSSSDHEDDDDEDMFDSTSEVQSLLSLPSASSASLSSFDGDEEDDDDEDKTVDPWADEDTADLRAHYADGWRVPRPVKPLGKRRRVEEIAISYDGSDDEGEMEEGEVNETQSMDMRSPVKPLPKRARTGDVVYSTELTQSVPASFNSVPTFSRPMETQSADMTTTVSNVREAVQSRPRSFSGESGVQRRVFYAPGEVVPAY